MLVSAADDTSHLFELLDRCEDALAEDWGGIEGVATVNPVTYLLETGRGFIAGEAPHVLGAFALAIGLGVAFWMWAFLGLRKAEAGLAPESGPPSVAEGGRVVGAPSDVPCLREDPMLRQLSKLPVVAVTATTPARRNFFTVAPFRTPAFVMHRMLVAHSARRIRDAAC